MRFCLLLSILASLSLVGGTRPATSTPAPQPNVLIVITDDQRADFVEAEAIMPAVRRYLAQNGTRFESAYATTPRCCPARAAIMTGQYAHNNGVGNNLEGWKLDHSTTLQAKLRANGYLTGFVGKFLNRWDLSMPPPYFDWWALAAYPHARHYDSWWNVNGDQFVIDERYGSVATADRAREFLRWAEGQDDAPWLLIASFFEPHFLFVPDGQYRKAEVTVPEVPSSGVTTAERQLRMLMSVDDAIEGTFREMERFGEKPDTLVIYISDNGLMLGERGIVNTKGQPYEPSVHVPMYLRWPDHVARGDIRADVAANIDIAPTVLEAAGLSTDGVDGRSLLSPANRDMLLLEGPGEEERWTSLVSPSWQYIEFESGWYEYYGSVPPPAGLADELAAVRDCAESACP